MMEINTEYKTKAFKRLMAKIEIDPETECWLWKGGLNRKGYGNFWFLGKVYRVHRATYILSYGQIPEGLQLAHICGRRRHCCNPDHVFPTTGKENMADLPLHPSGRTHCPHGHPYSRWNTYWRSDGGRECRACWRERCRTRRKKKTELAGCTYRGAQAARTHCPQGHHYEGENLYLYPNGHRACRTCIREHDRKRRQVKG